ncbi:MAG: NAD(P)/FAD-dependent oxidoreductase [Acidobacteriota bacterium]
MPGEGRRVVVVGAGAAGTMAAIFAAAEGVETLLLERTPDGGRKIVISGGSYSASFRARSPSHRLSPPVAEKGEIGDGLRESRKRGNLRHFRRWWSVAAAGGSPRVPSFTQRQGG